MSSKLVQPLNNRFLVPGVLVLDDDGTYLMPFGSTLGLRAQRKVGERTTLDSALSVMLQRPSSLPYFLIRKSFGISGSEINEWLEGFFQLAVGEEYKVDQPENVTFKGSTPWHLDFENRPALSSLYFLDGSPYGSTVVVSSRVVKHEIDLGQMADEAIWKIGLPEDSNLPAIVEVPPPIEHTGEIAVKPGDTLIVASSRNFRCRHLVNRPTGTHTPFALTTYVATSQPPQSLNIGSAVSM